jgi:hypothetical protein
VPNFPRLRALALFGRRPPQRVDSLLMPASENLHMNGHFRWCSYSNVSRAVHHWTRNAKSF